jgi:hypothetical protein
MDPEVFFSKAAKPAKAVCMGCPVRRTCLQEANAEEVLEGGVFRLRELMDGVRGGLTAVERWERRFPAEAAHYNEREARRQEKLRDYKRARYAEMTPEERQAYRGRNNGHSRRERVGQNIAA